MGDYILELRGISKNYPGVKALDNVSINFKRAEVHALAGENGAGKSTLIKCISGAIAPDKGTILLDGREFKAVGPKETIELGITTVYQELNLIPALSVAENVFVGVRRGKGILYDRKRDEQACREIMQGYGIDIPPDAIVRELSAAQRQLVEIVRAISRNVKLLILDEPTSSLTVHETEFLFKTIRRLKREGVTVIYISHVLDETFALSDRVSILRDGEFVKTLNTAETNRDELVRNMVGHEVSESFPRRNTLIGEPVLEAKKLTGNGIQDVSFTLHRGEILGFAGLVGAGRTELMELVYGAAKLDSGEILIQGKPVNVQSPLDAIKNSVGMIPEDRKLQGVFLRMTVKQNIVSANLANLKNRFGVMNGRRESALTTEFCEKLRIKSTGSEQVVETLSGGNQQKVAVAKALAPSPRILIFDEPTRGIDVGAKQEIYKIMNELVEQGHSIIMISSEMVELMEIADRIIVLSGKQVAGELRRGEYTQEKILRLASGESLNKGDLQ